MKRYLMEFLDFLFGSTILPMLVIAVSLCASFLTSDSLLQQNGQDAEIVPVSAYSLEVTSTSAVSTTMTSTTTRTTSVSTSTTVTTTAPVTETAEQNEEDAQPPDQPAPPPAPSYTYSYISAGESPNSDHYQSRLTIVGDSIASGFCAYGYIPPAHNVAKESLAVWNMNSYTFDVGGGSMGLIDAAAYANTPLYFVSIGMNDIFSYSPEDYAGQIISISEQILDKVPTATVVVGAITPVSDGNYYTTNDRIISFNNALENAVNDRASGQILFFNTNAVLNDPNTGCLNGAYGGGDGLHINGSAYGFILNCLFNFLDESDVMGQINEHDSQFE